jgi:hypothetical protein
MLSAFLNEHSLGLGRCLTSQASMISAAGSSELPSVMQMQPGHL